MQQRLNVLCNGDAVWFLWDRKLIIKYYLDERQDLEGQTGSGEPFIHSYINTI
jgi:hypothetical protein